MLLREFDTFLEDQPYLAALYKTMSSTMYFGLFRISEIVAGPHQVLAKDMHVRSNKKR